jgi:hypothetical protein
MAVGVKDTVEALEAARVILVLVKKVMADGKINVGDIGILFELVRALGVLNAGVQGLDQVMVEIKDMDAAEAEIVIAKAMEIVALFSVAARA